LPPMTSVLHVDQRALVLYVYTTDVVLSQKERQLSLA
jgi:hypothetical protein